MTLCKICGVTPANLPIIWCQSCTNEQVKVERMTCSLDGMDTNQLWNLRWDVEDDRKEVLREIDSVTATLDELNLKLCKLQAHAEMLRIRRDYITAVRGLMELREFQ